MFLCLCSSFVQAATSLRAFISELEHSLTCPKSLILSMPLLHASAYIRSSEQPPSHLPLLTFVTANGLFAKTAEMQAQKVGNPLDS